MKWKKLGKIFDPTDHQLPNGCKEFAQSPQALVFDDFVRIYFATRQVEEKGGKYLSHVAFADFDKTFRNVVRTSDNAVIPLGGLGCFDEHGIFPFNPLRYEDKIYAYTCGWSRRVSVSVETSVGIAISEDNGETFRRVGSGPVMTASVREPFLVGDAFVKVYDGVFHMWYMFGTSWKKFSAASPPDRTYKIGHAISSDGISWERESGHQVISDKLNDYECMALPTVIRHDEKYHMLFCYREAFDFRSNPGRGYRLGYAYSTDLTHWTRDDESVGIAPTQGSWDSEMLCYPNVFECDGDIYLLYNGNAFGRYGFGIAVLEQ